MAERLDSETVDRKLKTMPGWSRKDKEITRIFERRDFLSAMAFVMQVALLAERADHHPDIDIRWNKVTITLSTHSEDAITTKDIELAKEIGEL